MWRVDSLEKTLMLGEIGGRRRRDDRGWDDWMAWSTWWTWVWVNSGSWWWTGRPGVLWFMGLQIFRHDWATELNCTELWYLNMPVVNQEALWLPPKAPHFEFHDTLHSSLQPSQVFKLVKIQVLSVGSATWELGQVSSRTSFSSFSQHLGLLSREMQRGHLDWHRVDLQPEIPEFY